MTRPFFVALLLWSWTGASCVAESFERQMAELQARLASDPTNTTLLFKLGDLCHDEGVRDNREAVKLAEQYFKRLLALEPNQAMGLALLGSTLTMKGRDAFWPSTQIHYVKEGNRTMDAAVKLAPDDPDVRFVRAINNIHMPKLLGREEVVATDFAWLWERVQASPQSFKAERIQEIALNYGKVLQKQKRTDEAITVWRKGLQADPQSLFATQIREQLSKAQDR